MENEITQRGIAGLLIIAAACAVCACGQKSARFISAPPESTPGWKDYETIATPTDYEEMQAEETAAEETTAGEFSYSEEFAPGFAEYDAAKYTGSEPGWYENEEGWHYFDGELHMLTGWQRIGGEWYCFDKTGLMYADTVTDGSYVDASGKRLPEIPEGYEETQTADNTEGTAENTEGTAENTEGTAGNTEGTTGDIKPARARTAGRSSSQSVQTPEAQPQTAETAAETLTAEEADKAETKESEEKGIPGEAEPETTVEEIRSPYSGSARYEGELPESTEETTGYAVVAGNGPVSVITQ